MSGSHERDREAFIGWVTDQVVAALTTEELIANAHRPGAVVSCAGCGQVVYPDCKVLRNHDVVRLGDGRFRWWSWDMQCVVHECDRQDLVTREDEP